MISEHIWRYCGDLHQQLPPYAVGIISTLGAVVCGGLIGAERQRAQKPAGLRTLVLICLGAAIFTQASILMVGAGGDRTRIAAQIVSGIGFLGAGAIIRERGLVIGVTTGAGIWATAAVGTVLGAGYIAAGIFFTLLIVGVLAAEALIDRISLGPCKFATLTLHFDPDDGRGRIAIQSVLDEHQHTEEARFEEPPGDPSVVRVRFCDTHRDHRGVVADLARLRQVKRLQQG